MNKSFVTTDCTLTWLFEMQVELFYLRKNTLRQAQKAHVTHCSLSHVNTRMSTGFWIFLQENMLDWRPAGEDCSSGGLPRAGPESSKRLLRRGWFSDAIFPHQKCWCSAFFFLVHACICAKSLQSCLTLCNPTDRSPPGSSVLGILRARILEWAAMLSIFLPHPCLTISGFFMARDGIHLWLTSLSTFIYILKIFCWCEPFWKFLLNLLQYFFFFYVLVSWPWDVWDLSPQTVEWTCIPCSGSFGS